MKKAVAFASSVVLLAGLLTGCGTSSTEGGAVEAANKLEAIKEAGKLVIATSPDYAPDEFIDPTKQGQESIVGSEISLAYYLAEELGVELVIDQMAFDSCIGAVTSGKVDVAISGFSVTPERQEVVDFSDTYIWDGELSGHGILVLEENAGLSTAEDFAGMKVATQSGSLQETLTRAQLPSDIEVELVQDLGTAVQMLLTGKVDAISYQYAQGAQYAKTQDGLAMAEFMYEIEDEGKGILIKKGESELVEAINEILAKAEQEGLYATWYEEACALADSLGIE